MTSRALAWRAVTSDPARAWLAVLGVAVIGALLLDMLLLSHGLLISFRDLLDTVGYDVRVLASDGLPSVRLPIAHATALVAEVSGLDEVQGAVAVRMTRGLAVASTHASENVVLMSVTAGAEGHAWHLVAGQDLAEAAASAEPPLVVSARLASALGLAPGATLPVRITLPGEASALPLVTFRVAGVADFGFELANEFTAATTVDALQRAASSEAPDEAEVVLVASKPEFGAEGAVTAIRRLHPELRVYSNDQVVAQFDRNGFAYFRQISLVLSSITLGFAFLLVATLLTVSVNQRLSEVAALRALGFPRRRIAANLLWESAMLVGAGGLLALPLGGLLAVELDRILRSMPGIPERLHFFVLEPRAVVLHVALMAATAACAAAYPIWVASRLPISATLRREVIS